MTDFQNPCVIGDDGTRAVELWTEADGYALDGALVGIHTNLGGPTIAVYLTREGVEMLVEMLTDLLHEEA